MPAPRRTSPRPVVRIQPPQGGFFIARPAPVARRVFYGAEQMRARKPSCKRSTYGVGTRPGKCTSRGVRHERAPHHADHARTPRPGCRRSRRSKPPRTPRRSGTARHRRPRTHFSPARASDRTTPGWPISANGSRSAISGIASRCPTAWCWTCATPAAGSPACNTFRRRATRAICWAASWAGTPSAAARPPARGRSPKISQPPQVCTRPPACR